MKGSAYLFLCGCMAEVYKFSFVTSISYCTFIEFKLIPNTFLKLDKIFTYL